MLKNILIATDGSKHSEEAAKVGIELAKHSNGQVTVLYVVDMGSYIPMPFEGITPHPYAREEAAALRNILLENGEDATKHVEELVRESGVPYERMVVEGHPASTSGLK